MNTLVALALILLCLMVIIGGRKGFRSFLSLFFNFIVILITTILMTIPSFDPVVITIIACVIISCINLFYINEINSKTIIAFISTMITIIMLFSFIYVMTKKIMVRGFGEEEIEELSVFSLYIGIDFMKLGAAVIIMSTIGAITDISISITSPLHELFKHNPNMTMPELFKAGMAIGNDILGSNTNTLFFAFFGGYMALLLWIKDLSYSFGEIINSKVFSAEMVTILSAGIGIALVIPIASWLYASYLINQKNKLDN